MGQPTLVTVEPFSVAVLHVTGDYGKIPECFGRLYRWVASHGLHPSGMPSAVYLKMPPEVPPEEAVWELWAPLAGDVPPAEANGEGIEIRQVPGYRALSIIHVGPYDAIQPTYEKAQKWLAENGYEIAGAPMERYYSDANEVPPEEYLTEIIFPVRKVA
ncbi:MAG: GyrI-like domain-containing protein [Coriobacteriia bacterium]